jgi:hypothetical protein
MEPLTRGYRPPDPHSLCPLSTEFVKPPHKIPEYATEALLSVTIRCILISLSSFMAIPSVYTQLCHKITFCVDSMLKHCAANRKRRLSALPNVGPNIYDVKISGFTRNSIYTTLVG